MILYTTAALAQKHNACKPEFNKMAKHLGGVRKYGKNTPVSLLTILEVSGIQNAIWALRATTEPSCEKEARLFAADIAETIALPIFESAYPNDDRPRKAIETARRFAHGMATREELAAAGTAAWAAAWAAGAAAGDAARAAAGAAARAAAGDAAGTAAWAAAWAAGAAAGDAARAAAGDAAGTATWNAWAAWAAWAAAGDAARAARIATRVKIKDIFLKHFGEE